VDDRAAPDPPVPTGGPLTAPPAFFTVGHGARTADELVAVLRSAEVARVIDVRRYPGSRRHPQFGRDALAADLPGSGVDYEWWGDDLGGRRPPADPTRHPEWRDAGFRGFADYMDTKPFHDALQRLLTAAASGRPLAIMCAETLWWRCHRRLIADAAVARCADVRHLLAVGKVQPHPERLIA
jgi:uncharacterized protein (DUF488 family)